MSKKILIIKHGSIGDIFMAFRSVKAIYSNHKNITICSTINGLKTFELLNFKFDKIIDNRTKNLFTNINIIYKIYHRHLIYHLSKHHLHQHLTFEKSYQLMHQHHI